MAYMNQDKKAVIKAAIDAAIKVSGAKVKYSLTTDNSSIRLAIMQADIDLISNYNQITRLHHDRLGVVHHDVTDNYIQVNNYHLDSWFSGEALELMKALSAALDTGNYNNSDLQTDFFDVGHYSYLHIGKWDRQFIALQRDTEKDDAKKGAIKEQILKMMSEHGIVIEDLKA